MGHGIPAFGSSFASLKSAFKCPINRFHDVSTSKISSCFTFELPQNSFGSEVPLLAARVLPARKRKPLDWPGEMDGLGETSVPGVAVKRVSQVRPRRRMDLPATEMPGVRSPPCAVTWQAGKRDTTLRDTTLYSEI
jgi:hypothetical protein